MSPHIRETSCCETNKCWCTKYQAVGRIEGLYQRYFILQQESHFNLIKISAALSHRSVYFAFFNGNNNYHDILTLSIGLFYSMKFKCYDLFAIRTSFHFTAPLLTDKKYGVFFHLCSLVSASKMISHCKDLTRVW